MRSSTRTAQVVAIVASTGGPGTLAKVLGALPADFRAAILVVQHMAPDFVENLASWLDATTPLSVRVASDGERIRPGTVLLAPDGSHLEVDAGRVSLVKAPPELGLCPSGNRLMRSVARGYGPRSIGIVLTGMGEDGAAGLAQLHAAGGIGLVQDEQSCTIFGMPRAAIDAGGVDDVLPPLGLAARLNELIMLQPDSTLPSYEPR